MVHVKNKIFSYRKVKSTHKCTALGLYDILNVTESLFGGIFFKRLFLLVGQQLLLLLARDAVSVIVQYALNQGGALNHGLCTPGQTVLAACGSAIAVCLPFFTHTQLVYNRINSIVSRVIR